MHGAILLDGERKALPALALAEEEGACGLERQALLGIDARDGAVVPPASRDSL